MAFPGDRAFYVQLRRRLRQLREERQLTQQEVAEGCGIDYKYYQNLELGRQKNPSLELIVRFARFFDIHPSEVIQESE